MSLAQLGDKPDVACGHLGPPVAVHLKARLAAMHPAYFALAMATGIVAIACHTCSVSASSPSRSPGSTWWPIPPFGS